MAIKTLENIYHKLSMITQSFYFSLFALLFGFICWIFELTTVVVVSFAIMLSLILAFSKDVKNIFALIFYVPFFIPDILVMTDYMAYYVAVAIAVVSLATFLIVRIIKNRQNIKFGKLSIGLLFAFTAYLIGGIFGNFSLYSFLLILGFCIITYTLYFIATNFTQNLLEYLEDLFIIGAIILGIQITQTNFYESPVVFFSSEGVNTAVLPVMIGVISSFNKAIKGKRENLNFLLVIILTAFVVLSRCRMAMLVMAIIDVILLIILLKKTKKRKSIFLIFVSSIAIISILLLLFESVRDFLYEIIFGKTGLSGRGGLWEWCVDKFINYPIFGYGFIGDETFNFLGEGVRVIMAHNALLQWLTSTGVVGTILMVFYYISKYLIIFKSFSMQKLFVACSVLMLEATTIMDQAGSMDFFIVLMSILLISSIENLPPKPKLMEKEN